MTALEPAAAPGAEASGTEVSGTEVPTTAQPLVRCVGVGRTFGAGHRAVVALHDVTCEISAGHQIALTGRSGSGKSTLLHLLAGIDTPTAGTICWPGIGDRAHLRPGPIGIVFQGPSLLPPLYVVENVALPLVLGGTPDDEAHATARAVLARLNLGHLAGKLPDELSGGQSQQVAMARALAGSPKLVLADEPTGQLDRATGKVVVDTLIEMVSAAGAALVVNTHDREIADRLSLRWRLADGVLETNCLDTNCRDTNSRGTNSPDTNSPDTNSRGEAR